MVIISVLKYEFILFDNNISSMGYHVLRVNNDVFFAKGYEVI